MYADVAPAIPLAPASRQAYTYALPARAAGARDFSSVTIPFGPRTVEGVILRLHQQPQRAGLKTLKAIFPVTLTPEQIAFAQWLSRVAQGGLGYTLRLFLPKSRRVSSAPPPRRRVRTTPSAAPKLQAIIERQTEKRHQKIIAAARTAARRGQVLMLMPEQWQVEPLLKKVAAALPYAVAAYHSAFSASHLSKTWHEVKNSERKIIIGTHMALFLPFQKLRLVILEEEFYTTHKLWDQYPRLSNVYAAQQLAALHRAALLYTASFPSVRLRHALASGEVAASGTINPLRLQPAYLPFSLNDRLQRHAVPNVLISKLKAWHARGETTLLYYNRLKAEWITRVLSAAHLPVNTRALTLATSAIFTRQRPPFKHIVWLFPDSDLKIPDFRSHEHVLYTFARLHQLSEGHKIYLVPRHGERLEIVDDVDHAVDEMLRERRKFHYPPLTDLVRLTVSGKTRQQAWNKAVKIHQLLHQRLQRRPAAERDQIRVRGPYNSPKAEADPKNATHLLLSGPLAKLMPLYHLLPVDSADLDPAQIL